MSRCTRGSRCSCGSRWTINAIQVHIVDTCGGCKERLLQNVLNHPYHQGTRCHIIGFHITLEAIQRIGRINDQYTVAWKVCQVDSNHEAHLTTLCRQISTCETHGGLRRCIVTVGMTRWSRGSCGSRRSRGSRRTIHTIQVHIVYDRLKSRNGLQDILDVAYHQDA